MARLHFFFAGGGTGGHIYPALAVAQQIRHTVPEAKLTFFCSKRKIDRRILSGTDFEYIALPARGFSMRPDKFVTFCTCFYKSYAIAKKTIAANLPAVLLGIGGFVSAPTVLAAHALNVPVTLLNTDIVPGRANKLLARFAKEIFVQFEETRGHFPRAKKLTVTGCPLRGGFANPDRAEAIRLLGLDENRKTLLITGGSSGAASVNNAVCSALGSLAQFAHNWQIVHLAGPSVGSVQQRYENAAVPHKVLDYFDDMPALLSAADLVVGRAGAVSVAEYAAAHVPSICIPYPYHKDKHQYLNVGKLVALGCAVIVADAANSNKTVRELTEVLVGLMKNEDKRRQMATACRKISNLNAAHRIAQRITRLAGDA